ncbi:MAG: hypothetical protein SP4CHLAM5_08690 [Chlamydiia bacterium]|nr:hypothetical protein [Chlamydiia bacterium]MCH9618732.1 hypothetical protein [Chlamydiia bacterium]MCH9624528.1 hypothetical protein [Chlamydiia bacterium]
MISGTPKTAISTVERGGIIRNNGAPVLIGGGAAAAILSASVTFAITGNPITIPLAIITGIAFAIFTLNKNSQIAALKQKNLEVYKAIVAGNERLTKVVAKTQKALAKCDVLYQYYNQACALSEQKNRNIQELMEESKATSEENEDLKRSVKHLRTRLTEKRNEIEELEGRIKELKAAKKALELEKRNIPVVEAVDVTETTQVDFFTKAVEQALNLHGSLK